MMTRPTEASLQLLALAREVAFACVAELAPRAVIVGGSAAEGISDHWSDLDVLVYHDELPIEAAIAPVRRRVGGGELRVLHPWAPGDGYAESYPVRGVECQVGHTTVARTERHPQGILVDLDVESLHQKALDGLLHCVPLHGADLVRGWQERVADYPPALGRAMVERYLRFFPLWAVDAHLAARDATLFRQQMLVEAALNLLAVLSGLNRVYFSSFQFKRMHAFCERLALAPPGLADRLELLFSEPDRAAAELETLVAETVALVEAELPGVDTTAARRWLGERPARWSLSPSPPGSPAAPAPRGP
jgi:hypothetical protein